MRKFAGPRSWDPQNHVFYVVSRFATFSSAFTKHRKIQCFGGSERSKARKIRCFNENNVKHDGFAALEAPDHVKYDVLRFRDGVFPKGSQSAARASQSVPREAPELPRGQNVVFYDGFPASERQNTAFYMFLRLLRYHPRGSGASQERFRARLSGSKASPKRSQDVTKAFQSSPEHPQSVPKASNSVPSVGIQNTPQRPTAS